MGAIENAMAEAGRHDARVVFAERNDDRIRQAADIIAARRMARPLFPDMSAPDGRYLDIICSRRPGLKPALARRLLTRPLYRAAAMVALGEADVMVAGATNPTRRVIEAATMAIGLARGVSRPSSFFLMRLGDGREMVFADCAVNVAPDAAALADIAQASERSARALLGAARLALLSYSTGTSGAGGAVEKVRDAVALLHARGISAQGPVQGDAALNPTVAAQKGAGRGEANVLIFPSLEAGNIAYKLLQELGRAQAVGPFLQGFRRPVCDLSRGARVEDIVAATATTLALGRKGAVRM